MKYLLFITLAVSANAVALDAKTFTKGLNRLKQATKLNKCLDEGKAYADALRAGEDSHEALDNCLKQAKAQDKERKAFDRRIERLKKAGF